jgi:hypothetical protein
LILIGLKLKRGHFTKASHSLETVLWFWSFYAQTALVPALLSSAGQFVCLNELSLSNQEDIQSFVVIFALFTAFIV